MNTCMSGTTASALKGGGFVLGTVATGIQECNLIHSFIKGRRKSRKDIYEGEKEKL